MKWSDKKLGMHKTISRRDVVHGIGALGAASLIPGSLAGCSEPAPPANEAPYPPGLTGMRGNHDGAFEVAHALGRDGQTDWGHRGIPDYLLIQCRQQFDPAVCEFELQ